MLGIDHIGSSLCVCGRVLVVCCIGARGYSRILPLGGLSLVYGVELVVLNLVEWWMMLLVLVVVGAVGPLAGRFLRRWLRHRRLVLVWSFSLLVSVVLLFVPLLSCGCGIFFPGRVGGCVCGVVGVELGGLCRLPPLR
jgi:hypothetical protein